MAHTHGATFQRIFFSAMIGLGTSGSLHRCLLDTSSPSPSLPCVVSCQLLRHLPIASQEKIILGELQAMHECAPHVHTSLGRGAGNVTAVMWRDLVEVN